MQLDIILSVDGHEETLRRAPASFTAALAAKSEIAIFENTINPCCSCRKRLRLLNVFIEPIEFQNELGGLGRKPAARAPKDNKRTKQIASAE
jgi:hypothetical protein